VFLAWKVFNLINFSQIVYKTEIRICPYIGIFFFKSSLGSCKVLQKLLTFIGYKQTDRQATYYKINMDILQIYNTQYLHAY